MYALKFVRGYRVRDYSSLFSVIVGIREAMIKRIKPAIVSKGMGIKSRLSTAVTGSNAGIALTSNTQPDTSTGPKQPAPFPKDAM